jgi:diguanylate cyclase (GGDEF)-like protein/PAS domain S-box-containing protein
VSIPLVVLFVEDSESDMQLILRLLKKAGYEVTFERVETAGQMSLALKKRAWDIVISDYNLPEFGGPAALELLKEMQFDIPFIVVSGMMGEESAVAMMKAGAHDYLLKDNLTRLVPAVQRELAQAVNRQERKQAEEKLRQLSSAVEHSPLSILITDINGRIEYVNPKFTELTGFTADEIIGKTPAETYGTNELQPEAARSIHWQTIHAGEEWHGEMLNHKKNGQTYWESVSISPIFNLNGTVTHFVAVGEDITSRKADEEKIKHLNAGLEKMAMTDHLTSLYNRRYFMQRGTEEFKRSWRTNQSLALLMLDIDHFKKVNDTYGHNAGDMTLQQIAAALKSSLRETDILGRIGGEEFAVLLPNTLSAEAGLLAERIRQAVENLIFEVPGAALAVTISIGVVMINGEMSGIDDMLRNADTAMYKAKRHGGNCVVQYEDILDVDQPSIGSKAE